MNRKEEGSNLFGWLYKQKSLQVVRADNSLINNSFRIYHQTKFFSKSKG